MKKKLSLILLGFIILAAVFFRFSHLVYMEYKGDELVAFNMAQNLGQFQKFPLHGLSASIGARNPPLFIYLISLPAFLIKNSPVFLTGLVALLNVLTVIFTFFLVKKFFGKFEAFAAAGFLALSPWAIIYSRKLWAQNCLPFFSTAFLFYLTKALKGKNKIVSFFLAGFFLVLLFQIHYSGLIAFSCLLVFYLLYRKKFKLKPLFLGSLTGLIFFIPFLILQFQTNFKDLNMILQSILNLSNSNRKFRLIYPFYPLILSGGLKTFLFLGFDYLPFLSFLPKLVHLLSYMVFTANIILIFLGIIFSLRLKKKNLVYSIVLVWFLVPTLILSLTKIGDLPFYYLITFPSQFIFLAIALAQIRKIRRLKILTYLGIISAFLLTVIFNLYLGKFIIQEKVIRGAYGWTYRDKIRFIEGLKKELALPTENINASYCIKGHNPWEVRHLLARSLDYPKNKIQLEIALKENPDFIKAHYDLALIYFKEENFEALEKEKATLKRLDSGLFKKLEKLLSH